MAAEKVVVCSLHAAGPFGELWSLRVGRPSASSLFLVRGKLRAEDSHWRDCLVALAPPVGARGFGEKLPAELLGSRVDVREDLLLLLGVDTAVCVLDNNRANSQQSEIGGKA